MNEQQRNLLAIIEFARDDLLAGRPAERVKGALLSYLNVAAFDDIERYGADDEAWRQLRHAG